MQITEVRIKLSDEPGERLLAYCSVTFDYAFVVRDLKIIEGTNGPFVAMPSRKLTAHCPQCRMKNHLRAAYCNQCGNRLPTDRIVKDHEGRAKLYADIAHPINQACREQIQESVVKEFYLEIERAKQPDYVSRYDEYDYPDEPGQTGSRSRPPAPHYKSTPEQRSHGEVRPQHSPRTSGPNVQPPVNPPHQSPAQNMSNTPAANHRDSTNEFGAGLL